MPDNSTNVEEKFTCETSTAESETHHVVLSGLDSATAHKSLSSGELEQKVENAAHTPPSNSGSSKTAELSADLAEVPSYVDSSDEEIEEEEKEIKVDQPHVETTLAEDLKEDAQVSHPNVSDPHAASTSQTTAQTSDTFGSSIDYIKSDNEVGYEPRQSDFQNNESEPNVENGVSEDIEVVTGEGHNDGNDDKAEKADKEEKGDGDDNDNDDEDYDPEVTIATKEEAEDKTQPESYSTDPSAAEKLKEAYEAVMQSDLVKLEAFSKLSQENQMAAIQAVLQQKNVELPSLDNDEAPSNGMKSRPDLTQPMSAQEKAAYERFLAEEPQYSNWETLDKLPPGLRLFIGNLFNNPMLKEELFRILSRYGGIVQITIKLGYGFAQFKTAEQAANCVNGEKDIPFQGRLLRFNTSYGHKNPHGQTRGRERFDDGGNDQKRIKTDVVDVQIFVTDGSNEELGTNFRGLLRSVNLTYAAKTLSSTETSEEMVEAAYLGSIGACVVNGSKIDLQIFLEADDGGVKFDEYLGIEPSTVCELVEKAKLQKIQKRKVPGYNNYSQKSHNDGGRQQGTSSWQSFNNGRSNFKSRPSYGNQSWHRGQEGPVSNNSSWQPKGNWKQNQGYNNYNNYNNNNSNSHPGSYNNNIPQNRNAFRQNNYAGYPNNQGNLRNLGHMGPPVLSGAQLNGFQNASTDSNGYNPGNTYGQYTSGGWGNQINDGPQNFGAPALAPFPTQLNGPSQGLPPNGNAAPLGFPHQTMGGAVPPDAGYQGYTIPNAPMSNPMGPYGQSTTTLQPETSSALMDMLAKLGRK